MKPRYDALLFDLFDTLVHFDISVLPLERFGGDFWKAILSVSHEAIRCRHPELEFEDYCRAAREVQEEMERFASETQREMTADERFRRVARRLGISEGTGGNGAVEAALTAHFQMILDGVIQPEDYRDFLRRAAAKTPLGVISNYDHSPNAIQILEKFGIRPLFSSLIISADVGWRKPNARIFERALADLNVSPDRVLFVGDSPDADIEGARRLGIAAVWVKRPGRRWPEGLAAPTITVERITELEELLGG